MTGNPDGIATISINVSSIFKEWVREKYKEAGKKRGAFKAFWEDFQHFYADIFVFMKSIEKKLSYEERTEYQDILRKYFAQLIFLDNIIDRPGRWTKFETMLTSQS